jgi:hypothetical protein
MEGIWMCHCGLIWPDGHNCLKCGGTEPKPKKPGLVVTCPTCHGKGSVTPEKAEAEAVLTRPDIQYIIDVKRSHYKGKQIDARKRGDRKTVEACKMALEAIDWIERDIKALPKQDPVCPYCNEEMTQCEQEREQDGYTWVYWSCECKEGHRHGH